MAYFRLKTFIFDSNSSGIDMFEIFDFRAEILIENGKFSPKITQFRNKNFEKSRGFNSI